MHCPNLSTRFSSNQNAAFGHQVWKVFRTFFEDGNPSPRSFEFSIPNFGNYRNHTIFTRGDGRLRRQFYEKQTGLDIPTNCNFKSRRSHLQIDSIIFNSIHPSCSLLLNPLPFWPTALPSVAGMYRILRKTSNKRSRSKNPRRNGECQHDNTTREKENWQATDWEQSMNVSRSMGARSIISH